MSLKEMLGLWPVSPFLWFPGFHEGRNLHHHKFLPWYYMPTGLETTAQVPCTVISMGSHRRYGNKRRADSLTRLCPPLSPEKLLRELRNELNFVWHHTAREDPLVMPHDVGGTIRKVSKSVVTRYTKEESPLPLKQSLRDLEISSAF